MIKHLQLIISQRSLSGDEAISSLIRIICEIYETEKVPEDFRSNFIISEPKKTGADRCKQRRKISLVTNACKILKKIVYRRKNNRYNA